VKTCKFFNFGIQYWYTKYKCITKFNK